jgi:hypothetical protein
LNRFTSRLAKDFAHGNAHLNKNLSTSVGFAYLQSVPAAGIDIIRTWYRCCSCRGMRDFFTDAERFDSPQTDELPATPAAMPFLWTRTSKLAEVWEIVRATRMWPEVAITADSSGLCFSVTGNSMGHLNWEGRLELPFAPALLDELMAEDKADANPDRAAFQVQTNADVDRAVGLLRLAYLTADSKSPGMCS